MSGILSQALNIALLLFGFGFVIFWHELGHFIAAKWAGVKVEQFAVGFGQALLSWRKGLGFRWGSSTREFQSRIERHIASDERAQLQLKEKITTTAEQERRATEELGLGETEYRLNWIPLGGYVKMLGQDDLNPNATANDPRAYNMKPIGKRMVIVSAGVIMNVILAAIGFFALFLHGFDVPPPVVGTVLPNSPAQRAGLQVGDRIVMFDGKVQRDFTKIQLNVALVKEGEAVPVEVWRHDDPKQKQTLQITAARGDADTSGFLQLGIGPSPQLEGPDTKKELSDDLAELRTLYPGDMFAVNPGEKIIAIAGESLNPNDPKQLQSYWRLYQAIQSSNGKPVSVMVSDGKTTREVQAIPRFQYPFAGTVNFAGLVPRASILGISEKTSDARGKLQPGDQVESVTVNTDTKRHPTLEGLKKILSSAGENGQTVSLTVVRNGQQIPIANMKTVKIQGGDRGLGVSQNFDAESTVIGAIVPDSTADKAKISVTDSSDVMVTKLGDEPVKTFHDIKRIIANAKPGNLPITIKSDAGEKTVDLNISNEDISTAKNQTYRVDMALGLHGLSQPRKTKSFVEAAAWGAEETRDLIVQFYITLHRMFSGSVPAKNMMGPYGIVKAGAGFADKGLDYLIWFLAMISANLAVVNFLPIPIVDGGLFMFLIIEKFQGKPLSPRVQSIAQLVGIALIASVFIFVTYQDIIRR